MAICQDMIKAFLFDWKNDHYGKRDLETGIQYCEDLIKYEHRKYEPFHHYDLKKFIKWAKKELKNFPAA